MQIPLSLEWGLLNIMAISRLSWLENSIVGTTKSMLHQILFKIIIEKIYKRLILYNNYDLYLQ
jgi:hypothetical protein